MAGKRTGLKIFFFLVVVLGTAALVVLRGLNGFDLTSMEQEPGVVTMLFLGLDRNYGSNGEVGEGAVRADTIIFACLNTSQETAYLFSLPRDTLVEIPGKGPGILNAAHAYGGPNLITTTVEELLGVHIPYWAAVDFEGFETMVNALGGVEVDVEKDLKYYDRAGDFKIDIKAGRQVLNGEEALQYARFRNDALGDIGRIRRQQKLLASAAQKALSWQSISRWPALYQAADRNLDTNMTQLEMAKIGAYLRQVGLDRIETRTLPGNFSGNHWRLDLPAARELVSEAMATQ